MISQKNFDSVMSMLSDEDRSSAAIDLMNFGNAFIQLKSDIATGEKSAKRIYPHNVVLTGKEIQATPTACRDCGQLVDWLQHDETRICVDFLKQQMKTVLSAIQFFKENENTEKRGVALRSLWEVFNEAERFANRRD